MKTSPYVRSWRCSNAETRAPGLTIADKLFWLLLRRFWCSWRKTLIVVSPDTVVRWHRAGFRLYWRLISRVRMPVGRRPVTDEIRELIFQMVALIALLAGLNVPFLCTENHPLGEEAVASYLYQVHLYHWLESNDYGRFLVDDDL